MKLTTSTGALRAWVTVLLVVIPITVLSVAVVFYVNRQTRLICGVVVLIDDRNQRLPPADPDTMAFRRELHRYRQLLACKGA